MPPLYTSFSSRCWRNILITRASGFSATKEFICANTQSAAAGPLATSKLMSNCRSLSISVNFTIGTFAFAMTCTFFAMFLRVRAAAKAFKPWTGTAQPVLSITASMSLEGRYSPVAYDPKTANSALGQMDKATSLTLSTAASRLACSFSLGCMYRVKSTISWCSRRSGLLIARIRCQAASDSQGGSVSPCAGVVGVCWAGEGLGA
mmetsp:Transcript_37222/g.62630  ORF Transcript_37222/g.62630 Transcript_37222/m.62630 type:complete len:205 (+) Transcript_37222:445-1059(+)